jgi:hypothetical protein
MARFPKSADSVLIEKMTVCELSSPILPAQQKNGNESHRDPHRQQDAGDGPAAEAYETLPTQKSDQAAEDRADSKQ